MTQRKPTIDDVARAAGVSKGAVSFALNDRPGVAPETRERILRAAAQIGWTPNHRGRALAGSRALAVGLILARLPETLGADPFFPAFIAGIEQTLSPLGQSLLLHMVPDHASEVAGYRQFANGRVDGVFLTDLRVDDARPALAAELRLPAVKIAPFCDDDDTSCVAVDDRPGISAAVTHLIELGHRRIAHVGGPEKFVHGGSRKQAWAASMAAAGLPEGPFVQSDFSAQGGSAATRELLDLPERPTAIVYANDVMAMAGMAVAAARGLDVPRDLSITGFDDTELGAHLRPPLTSVHTDAFGWGRAAADRLMSLIEATPPQDVAVAPPFLVVRASTARPPFDPSSDRHELENR